MGFDPGDFDENLLLKCASAVLVSNPRPEAIVQISGETIRNRFDEVISGILGALDFLKANLNVNRIQNLPYQAQLIPLSVFFATSGSREIVVDSEKRKTILKWFWRSSFGRRYSSQTIRALDEDILFMLQLKSGQASQLGDSVVIASPYFFQDNQFSMKNVDTKVFILLLADEGPLSWVSGQPIDLSPRLKSYNKAEFHHIFPKAHLKPTEKSHSINCLSNYCFLSRSENKHLGGVAPSQYRSKLGTPADALLASSFCSVEIFNDEFSSFIKERSKLLSDKANRLCGN